MKQPFKCSLMAGLLATLLFEFGCVSYRKRPRRLLSEVAAQHRTFDAVIVPGVPFEGHAWDSIMKARVLWSYVLYRNGIVRNIIYSGGAVYSPYYEAKIMGLYARQLGIPEAHIFFDTLAEHSTENVYYSYELARSLHFKSMALATDPFQSSMLRSFTRKRFGTEIAHLPFVQDSLQKYSTLNPVIDPAPAFEKNFRSIREREGAWERFKGTLGRHIPWEKYPGRVVPPL